MKMVMAVVSRDQADRVLDKLISAGYGATFTESRGGMLRQAQQLIFIAVEKEKVEGVIDLIRRECHSRVEVSERTAREGPLTFGDTATTTEVGYAVVFVWDLERFETY
ncbi:MAG: cyclic-di-AMP receptor [Anaerolineae bacterium]